MDARDRSRVKPIIQGRLFVRHFPRALNFALNLKARLRGKHVLFPPIGGVNFKEDELRRA